MAPAAAAPAGPPKTQLAVELDDAQDALRSAIKVLGNESAATKELEAKVADLKERVRAEAPNATSLAALEAEAEAARALVVSLEAELADKLLDLDKVRGELLAAQEAQTRADQALLAARRAVAAQIGEPSVGQAKAAEAKIALERMRTVLGALPEDARNHPAWKAAGGEFQTAMELIEQNLALAEGGGAASASATIVKEEEISANLGLSRERREKLDSLNKKGTAEDEGFTVVPVPERAPSVPRNSNPTSPAATSEADRVADQVKAELQRQGNTMES